MSIVVIFQVDVPLLFVSRERLCRSMIVYDRRSYLLDDANVERGHMRCDGYPQTIQVFSFIVLGDGASY